MLHKLAAHWQQWLLQSAPLLAPEAPSWEQYIRAPQNRIVYPVAIVPGSIHGNVTNPNALLAPGGGVTILSRAANSTGGGKVPSIVVDFGQPVVGFLSI